MAKATTAKMVRQILKENAPDWKLHSYTLSATRGKLENVQYRHSCGWIRKSVAKSIGMDLREVKIRKFMRCDGGCPLPENKKRQIGTGLRKFTSNDFYSAMKKWGKDPSEWKILTPYRGIFKPGKVKHLVCGVTFDFKQLCAIIHRESGCVICNGYRIEHITNDSIPVLIKHRNIKGWKFIQLIGKKKITVQHLKCGIEREIDSRYFLSGAQYANLCLHCSEKLRTIKLRGHKFIVEGTEDLGVRYLLNKGADPSTIFTIHQHRSKVPKIAYTYKGEKCKHYPDIFIPKTNTIVECKDIGTFGIAGEFRGMRNDHTFSVMKRKAKAAIKAGYIYEVLVFNRAKKILYTLPKDWHEWKKIRLKKHLMEQEECDKVKRPKIRWEY